MPLILGTNSIKDTGYDVANSLRFNDGSSDYINRTPSGAGNRKTWTFSIWFKRSNISLAQKIFSVTGGGSNNFECYFNTNDTLAFYHYSSNGGVTDSFLGTNQVFRDVSAWYHLVLSVDTTQGTASNRVKMYVNGSQITSFSTAIYFNQNYDTYINSTNEHRIGANLNNSQYFDGYMCETVLVDGSQLGADSFGEFDSATGIWKPIDVSGLTFGTNGFYLDFENSGSLGADVSGNGNNFTVNNLTAIDQSTDTCTNNFATFNPLGKANLTYAEGNTKITNSSGAHNGSLSTLAVNKGKWYYEVKFIDGSQTRSMAGICKVTDNLDNEYVGDTANSYGYFRANGNKFNNSTSSSYGTTPSNNSIISVAFDADNGTLWFGLNGTWQNSATKSEIEAGTTTNSAFSSITMDDFFAFACSGEDATCQANFGSPSYAISSGNTDGNGYGNFEYAVPNGYYSLNSKNLAEYG